MGGDVERTSLCDGSGLFKGDTHTKITGKLIVYNGMLAFITCLKNGFIDFAQNLLVAVVLCQWLFLFFFLGDELV